jgi:molecular chaperone GrpE
MSEPNEPVETQQDTSEESAVAGSVPAGAVDDIDQLRDEVAQSNDRALRAAAELENFRRRSRQQLDDGRRYAAVPLIQALLPVLDNLDRAIEAADETDKGGLLEGVKMVASQMHAVLVQFECTQIEALGEAFDPNWHEAILQQPSNEYDAGAVMLVTETGFKLHDRVVRPAKVIVSTGKAEA